MMLGVNGCKDKKFPPNLVAAWIAAETAIPGRRQIDALADLNKALGASYTPARLGNWRRGERPIPQHVWAYMIELAVGHVLALVGVDLPGDDLDTVVLALQPPPPKTPKKILHDLA